MWDFPAEWTVVERSESAWPRVTNSDNSWPCFFKTNKKCAWPLKWEESAAILREEETQRGKEREIRKKVVREKRQIEKEAKKQDGSSSCLSVILQNQLPSSSFFFLFLLDAKWLKLFSILPLLVFFPFWISSQNSFSSLLFSPGLWASSYPPSFPPSEMELHPLSGDTEERGVDQEAALSRMWPPRPCEAWNLPHWAKEPVLKVLNWMGVGKVTSQRSSTRPARSSLQLCPSEDFLRNKEEDMHSFCFIKGIPPNMFKPYSIDHTHHVVCLFFLSSHMSLQTFPSLWWYKKYL